MSTLYFVGTEENIIIANAQINNNCGLPFRNTERWAEPTQAYEQNFWFIPMPPAQGWTREDGTYFSQEEMILNVVNVTIEESNPSWWPPINPQI